MQIEVLKPQLLQPSSGDIIRPTNQEGHTALGVPRDEAQVRGSDGCLCWQDLHGKLLVVLPDADFAPAKRCVAVHAFAAVLSAEAEGWKQKGEVVLPAAGWESPGVDRELLARMLRDAAALHDEGGECSWGEEASVSVTEGSDEA